MISGNPPEAGRSLCAPELEGRAPAPPPARLTGEDEARLDKPGSDRQRTLNRLLFPGPTAEFEQHCQEFGDTSRMSALEFFYGLVHGQEHRVRLEPGWIC